jgi:hypothetical protein
LKGLIGAAGCGAGLSAEAYSVETGRWATSA